MTEQRIQKWREVAALLEQGWRLDGKFDLVSPTGQRRSAWGNAVKACLDRGLVPLSSPAARKSRVVETSIRSVMFPDDAND